MYSADADTRTLGSVFYRESMDPDLLEVSSSLYSMSFLPANFTSMFIATWFYVGYYDGGIDLVSGYVMITYHGLLVVSWYDIVILHWVHGFMGGLQ